MQKIITLRELPIGGTAVGTGINTHPDFARQVCAILNHETHEAFHEAPNHFEAQHTKDSMVGASGMLKTVAVSLMKIANDIRWMGAGPRCGIGELILPAVQPGSSIMPGKVNPVIPEAVMQVCCHVIGHDAAISAAAVSLGNFELHTGMPVIAWNFNEAVRLLANACDVFVEKCIDGLQVDKARCSELIEKSLMLCTPLAPIIGYDAAAAIAKEAHAGAKTVREVALAHIKAGKIKLTEAQLNEALDVRAMTMPSEKVMPVSG
jgi:fumarate hydratase class II